ncbi:hypothetical protein AB4Y44_42275, partial [Paraburkholderia sp. BR10937]|uniref:hypothetical protein n=1 Tax=Paraburkholderia sp. BR10937 TaxID=3236994 RepID=UPI0034D1651D
SQPANISVIDRRDLLLRRPQEIHMTCTREAENRSPLTREVISGPRRIIMYFGLFALAIGLAFYFYGGYMVKKGREADRARRSRSQ